MYLFDLGASLDDAHNLFLVLCSGIIPCSAGMVLGTVCGTGDANSGWPFAKQEYSSL